MWEETRPTSEQGKCCCNQDGRLVYLHEQTLALDSLISLHSQHIGYDWYVLLSKGGVSLMQRASIQSEYWCLTAECDECCAVQAHTKRERGGGGGGTSADTNPSMASLLLATSGSAPLKRKLSAMELSLPVICKETAISLLTTSTPSGDNASSSLRHNTTVVYVSCMRQIHLHETSPKLHYDRFTVQMTSHRLLTLANVNNLAVQLSLAFPHGRALVRGTVTHRILHLLVRVIVQAAWGLLVGVTCVERVENSSTRATFCDMLWEERACNTSIDDNYNAC